MVTTNTFPPGESKKPDTITEIEALQVLSLFDAGKIVLVDVRETVEYEADHIPGSLLCPLSTFDPNLFPRFPGKPVVIHCAVGKRSAAACKQLLKSRYEGDVLNLTGGIRAWNAAGYPTETQADLPKEVPFLLEPQPDRKTSKLQAGKQHPGQILLSEFIIPFSLTLKELADEIGVPASRISAIVRGNRSVTPETAIRLARYLCTTDEFWLRLQNIYDLEKARRKHRIKINKEVAPRRISGK